MTLLKVRGAFLRAPDNGAFLRDKRILEAFAESGYLSGNEEREIVTCGAWNARANRRPDISTLRQFADYREPGAVKMAYDFTVADAGAGWTHIVTETRIQVLDDPTRRGLARYWRLIVPGSGLLRRQWLDGIRRRAENPSSPAACNRSLTQVLRQLAGTLTFRYSSRPLAAHCAPRARAASAAGAVASRRSGLSP